MVKEEGAEGKAVFLTPPLALEGGLAVDHKVPSSLERVINLLKNVRPGSDLTRLQLPPIFNLPKSQLQLYGECVYCIGEDMLSRCANGKNALERFTSVVAWNISTTRPAIFGFAPFNPVLGETHHVSRGSLNVLLEQVSHHPPVTALHATDENANVELIWSQNPVPKFYGTSVDVVVHGKKQLNLLNFGENYEMNTPRLLIRFFPVPGVDWVGNVRIRCKESGLEADLCYKGHSFLGFRSSSRSVKGRIFDSSSSVTIYDIDGHWDRIITMKDVQSGKLTVLYDAKGAISILKTPKLQDQKGLLSSESTLVWSEVSQAVVKKEWEKAREAKRAIEENERKLDRERKAEGDSWVPKHFKVAHTEDGWECNPKQKSVPSAPIIVEI
ncbi:oxysterol-binding protein-related protein 4B-like [Magnolia sinica]|uniref:oxysterol-binding protein-related protein 4B-like n=1 Tax=Magnolia sinica TaxID=86752 RepID=UPI0026585540|nr:oxysterol-binding protein-related protein 4B-like [Magnolia sinica]